MALHSTIHADSIHSDDGSLSLVVSGLQYVYMGWEVGGRGGGGGGWRGEGGVPLLSFPLQNT